MFKCVPCLLGTKSLLEDITTHVKGMSSGGHPQPQPMQSPASMPGSAIAATGAMAEATERLKKNRKKKKQQQQQLATGEGGRRQDRHVEGEDGGELQVDNGREAKEEEWVAEVDRGVLISFVSLPDGGNRIHKIRFREDMFDAPGAQRWWNDNYEDVLSLYSVQKSHASPLASEDEGPNVAAQESSCTQTADNSEYNSAASSSSGPAEHPQKTTTERGHERRVVIPGKLVEWVVEDQPGVFITVRSLPNGGKELRRVELSRVRFGEVKARVWWEENKDRLHRQYT